MIDYVKSRMGITENQEIPTQMGYPVQYNDIKLMEYKTWFESQEDEIEMFYKQVYQNQNSNIGTSYFWKMKDTTEPGIHSGLPRNIAKTMARIMLHNGYEIEEEDKVLDEILRDNEFNALLEEAMITESWGGRVAFKVSFDKSLTKFPIIEVVSPLGYDVISKRGRVQEIQFKSYEKVGRTQYKLVEYYGKGYIKYKLFRVKGGKEEEVPLSALYPNLKDYYFNRDFILAEHKDNNNKSSDFHGLISEFHALDESMSGMITDIRMGAVKTYIPEKRILKGETKLNPFRNNYIALDNDNSENGKNEITFQQPEIRVQQYKDSKQDITENILAAVGLNKASLGYESQRIGDRLGAEARRLMEGQTLRTREAKVELWEPFLSKLFYLFLNANSILNKTSRPSKYYTITFNEYLIEDDNLQEDTIEKVEAGIITPEEAKEKLETE